MASDVAIQTLLLAMDRPLRPLLAHWLTPAKLRLRKETQIHLYLERLHNAAQRSAVLAQASEAARAVLAHALDDAEATLGDTLARTAAAGYPCSLAAVGELHALGLLLIENPAAWPGRMAVWSADHALETPLIPAALARAEIDLPRPQPALPHVAAAVQEHGAEQQRLPATDGVQVFFDLLARKAVKVTQEGGFAARSTRLLEQSALPALPPDAPTHPARMLAFARQAGLARADSTGAVIPTRAFAAFRRQTRAEQISAILAFASAGVRDSAACVEEMGFSPLAFAHAALRGALADAPTGTWFALDAVTDAVRTRASAAFACGTKIPGWSWTRSTQHLPSRAAWAQIVAAHLEQWWDAAGALTWGISADGARCFRLSETGAFWLHAQAQRAPAPHAPQLVVQQDFTAVLTHSGAWDPVGQVLAVFAARTGDDNASVFHFTKERVQSAIQHGHAISELLETLERVSAYPLPENVRQHLQEWGHRSADATLYRDATLFSFDSTALRDEFVRACGAERARPIAALYALLLASDAVILDLMSRYHAIPIDYAQPPVAGIEISERGEVVCQMPLDLRVQAVRDALARPDASASAPGAHYLLSHEAMRCVPEPQEAYERLIRLPGRPLPLPVLIRILHGLGLLPLPPAGTFHVLEHFRASDRTALRAALPWNKVLRLKLARDTYLLDPACLGSVKSALASAKTAATIQTVVCRLPAREA